jgi:predicted Zn-dependent peptidase
VLRSEPLSARRLAMIKRQYLAQMAISMENNEGSMLGAGKSLLVHNEIDTLEEAYKKVQAVTAEQITEVAEEIFSKTSTLIYQ